MNILKIYTDINNMRVELLRERDDEKHNPFLSPSNMMRASNHSIDN